MSTSKHYYDDRSTSGLVDVTALRKGGELQYVDITVVLRLFGLLNPPGFALLDYLAT